MKDSRRFTAFSMRKPAFRRTGRGFTLLELLIVIAIVGILAGLMLPSMKPATYDQLRSTAQIVAADLAYARSLAVANNSKYTMTFKVNGNKYTLEHTGDNAALDNLPETPFTEPNESRSTHHVQLEELPHIGPTVRLAAVTIVDNNGAAIETVDDIEFQSSGGTKRTQRTRIWLTAGNGNDQRFMAITVNPSTGLTEIGEYTNVLPSTSS